MKHYSRRSELRAALDDAAKGGQALFTHIWTGGGGSPRWFRGTKTIGKLFDQDLARLSATAGDLGAHPLAICRLGQRGQHVDLEGEPLRRAIAMTQSLSSRETEEKWHVREGKKEASGSNVAVPETGMNASM